LVCSRLNRHTSRSFWYTNSLFWYTSRLFWYTGASIGLQCKPPLLVYKPLLLVYNIILAVSIYIQAASIGIQASSIGIQTASIGIPAALFVFKLLYLYTSRLYLYDASTDNQAASIGRYYIRLSYCLIWRYISYYWSCNSSLWHSASVRNAVSHRGKMVNSSTVQTLTLTQTHVCTSSKLKITPSYNKLIPSEIMYGLLLLCNALLTTPGY
jgi:hypothetical protein